MNELLYIDNVRLVCELFISHYNVYITTEPEEILVADGDGRKAYAVGVDDLNVDGFGMAGQVHDTIGHEPDEETACSKYQQ